MTSTSPAVTAMAFGVALFTLVVQRLTRPAVIRGLGFARAGRSGTDALGAGERS